MRRLLLAAVLTLISDSAWAQNPTCPDRPTNDSTNACANTRFVHNNVNQGAITTITTSGALPSSSGFILCNAAGGNIALTTVTVSGTTIYTVKKSDSSANTCSITTVDGGTYTLTHQYESIDFFGSSSTWYIR